MEVTFTSQIEVIIGSRFSIHRVGSFYSGGVLVAETESSANLKV